MMIVYMITTITAFLRSYCPFDIIIKKFVCTNPPTFYIIIGRKNVEETVVLCQK